MPDEETTSPAPDTDSAQLDTTAATETGVSADEDQAEDTTTEESEVDYWKRRARENEKRSKDNHRELERLKRESMSEQERAIAEARDQARAEVLRETSGQLVDAEIRSAAVNRPVNVDALLDSLDRSKFVDDEGNVDRQAVTTWLDQLAPAQTEPRQARDLAQGARGVTRSDPAEQFGQLITNSLR